jgi:hypothetical protein
VADLSDFKTDMVGRMQAVMNEEVYGAERGEQSRQLAAAGSAD